MPNKTVCIHENRKWAIFHFPVYEEFIADFMLEHSGGKVGYKNHKTMTVGIPSSKWTEVVEVIKMFGFTTTNLSDQESIIKLKQRYDDLQDGRKISFNKKDDMIHILNKFYNPKLDSYIQSMDGAVKMDAQEYALNLSPRNSHMIIKLNKNNNFSIEEPCINAIFKNLASDEKIYCLHNIKNIFKPETFFDCDFKIKDYSHQNIGITALIHFNYFCLFDEMGLGKTFQMIGAFTNFFKNKICDSGFVAAPAGLRYTWYKEICKYSNLKPVVLTGTKKKRDKIGENFANGDGDILIFSYDGLRNDKDLVFDISKNKNGVIVADEIQEIKNPFSKRTQALFHIRDNFLRRYGLSGTPVANHPEDLHSILSWISDDALGGFNYWQMLERFTIRREFEIKKNGRPVLNKFGNPKKAKVIVGRKNQVELRTIVQQYSLRRTKNNIEGLPEKVFETVYVDLKGEQKKMYKKMSEEMIAYLSSVDINNITEKDKENITTADNPLTKMIRLIQLTSNPETIFPNYHETPAKFLELDRIVETQMYKREETKKKMIIFTNFVLNGEQLCKRYEKYNPIPFFGKISSETKSQYEDKFQSSNENGLIIGTIASLEKGYTFTAADLSVYLDKTHRLSQWLQSQDRIHRLTSEGTAAIISILARNTYDEIIDEMLKGKEGRARFLQGDDFNFKNKSDNLSVKYILDELKKRK